MSTQKSTSEYTLEQLAAAAGMTVRNVRSYQTRGLIPPPQRRGRHSIYGPEHLTQLEGIRLARSQGATLGLISSHLGRGGTLDGRGLERTWLAGTGAARPERTASLDGVLSRAGAAAADRVTELVEAGVLHRPGRRVVADRAVAGPFSGLNRHGLAVERVLDLCVAAMHAGQSLGAAAQPELQRANAHERARTELVDLLIAVIGTVLTATLLPPEQG